MQKEGRKLTSYISTDVREAQVHFPKMSYNVSWLNCHPLRSRVLSSPALPSLLPSLLLASWASGHVRFWSRRLSYRTKQNWLLTPKGHLVRRRLKKPFNQAVPNSSLFHLYWLAIMLTLPISKNTLLSLLTYKSLIPKRLSTPWSWESILPSLYILSTISNGDSCGHKKNVRKWL